MRRTSTINGMNNSENYHNKFTFYNMLLNGISIVEFDIEIHTFCEIEITTSKLLVTQVH